METIKVELLREIKHGENGKVFKYSPSKRGGPVKHTIIPKNLYNALKDTKPPHFRIAQEVVIETVGAVESEVVTDNRAADVKTKDETLKPIKDIEYADPEEVAEDDKPSEPLAEDASVAEVQAVALEKIDGVGPALARNLVDAGFTTVADVALTEASTLDDIKGIHKGNVDDIIAAAQSLVG